MTALPIDTVLPVPAEAKPVPEPVTDVRERGETETPFQQAQELFEHAMYSEVLDMLGNDASHEDAMLLAGKACANIGRLEAAVKWCDRAVDVNKLKPEIHHFRAMVLLEQDFVMAHFTLGNTARNRGRHDRTRKHFRNALSVLKTYGRDEIIPNSEGMTAGRLSEVIQSLT